MVDLHLAPGNEMTR